MRNRFSGTQRFKVVRQLGEGGMGAVYECLDIETGSRVALKTLLFAEPGTLLHFKDEFRMFQHIHHQNLVSLGELFEENGLWCFTMELVHGRDILAHVRRGAVSPSSPTEDTKVFEGSTASRPPLVDVFLDPELLRDALVQLTQGLMALHDHGKVHCDVKPSNILVTDDHRLVLLDFGIAKDYERAKQLFEPEVGGTPAYMAPEQAAGVPITPAADWYAVGTVLFEAMTGRLPFEGNYVALIQDKLEKTAPDPRSLAPSIPPDLAALATRLLATLPEERPAGPEILASLGVVEAPSSRSVPVSLITTRGDTRRSHFVGRARERKILEDAFGTVRRESRAVAVYLQGESGVGKSALVSRFLDTITMADPRAVVLTGACYEHETVPYKAVDGVVDSLSHYLKRLPDSAVAALLPPHAFTLAQAFPVLSRVEAFAEAPLPRGEIDPLERRSRVFAALRELLTRIAARVPLVICIDDLQWADADSFALLGDILRPPESPALLLLATVVADADETELQVTTGPAALPPGGAVVAVPRLDENESRELAESLAKDSDLTLDAESVVQEAQGYPLFLHELVRHRAMQPDARSKPIALEEAIWSRVESLDDASRRLLEVVALAPGPMMQATATRAAGIEPADAIKHIKRLKTAHFARTKGGTRATDLIEPYHGRTREAVRAKITEERRRGLHRRIAVVMQTNDLHAPEDLAVHWREAGENERAAEYAQKAAARAEAALAFDRAAAHYRMVESLGILTGKDRRGLLVQLGNALANAGRSLEAAEAFRGAAEGASDEEARELATRTAEHLLRSGHIDEGLAELRRVLATVDISYPGSTRAAIASLLWSQLQLAIRGLGFRSIAERRVPVDVLARIDACWAASTGLFVVDQVRGADFGLRHLVLALSAGEPFRVFRGLAFHAVATAAAGGERSLPEARGIIERARAISEDLATPFAAALLATIEEGVAYLVGDFVTALERGRVAIDLLRSTCRGVAWELASTRQQLYWSLAFTGRVRELAQMARSNLREALETGDHYAATGIRSGLPNLIWLAEDDPKRAREEADQSIAVWSRSDAFLQHLLDLVAQVDIDLYEGEADRACERVARVRRRIEGAGLARVELNRILILDVASRAALAKARTLDAKSRRPFFEAAKRDVAQLEKERPLWGRALAAPKRACVARLEGDPAAETLASRAVEILRSAKLDLYAAACAHLAGVDAPELAGHYQNEGIVHPSRFARVFFPGW